MLVLYVSSDSRPSVQARSVVHRALARYDSRAIQLCVVDLETDPRAGVQDGVVYTPTLVRRSPLPAVHLSGALIDERSVRDLVMIAESENRSAT
jgi:hypothetical protein